MFCSVLFNLKQDQKQKLSQCAQSIFLNISIEYWTFQSILKVRLCTDSGPKSPDFDFLRKTGLFRTGLSPDSIPNQVRYPGNFQWFLDKDSRKMYTFGKSKHIIFVNSRQCTVSLPPPPRRCPSPSSRAATDNRTYFRPLSPSKSEHWQL